MIERDFIPGVSRNQKDREARSYDFGKMIQRMPAAVAVPKSTDEVSSIIQRAAREEVPIAIRGGGHSQGGQSLTDGGLVLDMTELDQIELIGQGLVRAQGGAQWGKIVDALHGTGQLPRVLADIGEVTVGGTLAAGGWGSTSHRYGAQVGQIEQLEVVTGTGKCVRCSRTENTELFDAVRAGQGQFGIITDAWIRLRKAGERIRLYALHYYDFDRFANDFEQIIREGQFDHLRAETRIHDRQIILTAGVEYDESLEDEEVLEGLGYDEARTVKDTDKVGRAGMFPKWGFFRFNYHPWRDWFLPWEALRTLLTQPWLDPDWVPRWPDSWTGTYPIKTGAVDAPLFISPDGEHVFSCSILTVIIQHEKAIEMVARLREIDRAIVELGGKSYLSGRVDYGRGEWEEHYEEKLEMAIKWKEEFDPKQVFQGGNMPFSESSEASS